MAENYLVEAATRLATADAVAAVILREDGRYVLQKRDNDPRIWYPDHWGLFGGAVEEDKDLIQALRRELMEELEYDPPQWEYFFRFDFDMSFLGAVRHHRTYFIVPISIAAYGGLVLHEGASFGAFPPEEVLGGAMKIAPYDAFALFLHHARDRISGGPATPA